MRRPAPLVFEDATFTQDEIALAPGDRLVVFTDGVTETTDRRDEEYGEERLVASIAKHAELDAERLADAILDDLERFKHGKHRDDVTLLVLSVE